MVRLRTEEAADWISWAAAASLVRQAAKAFCGGILCHEQGAKDPIPTWPVLLFCFCSREGIERQ